MGLKLKFKISYDYLEAPDSTYFDFWTGFNKLNFGFEYYKNVYHVYSFSDKCQKFKSRMKI